MTRVEVPDAHDRGYVALAGTPPNESETYLGQPREEDIRVGERNPRDVQVRQDDDGTRYVGVKQQYADKVQSFFADEYGVEYEDGHIVGMQTDTTPDETPTSTTDRPAEPGETADAHWNAVVAAIESGAYDDSLDMVADSDDRESVQTAIAERREVLS